MTNRRRPNVALGMAAGLAMAILASLTAVLIFLLRGPSTFEHLGVSLWACIAIYIGAGTVGGAVFGLLLPLTTSRLGATCVGIIVAIPLYLGVAVLLGEVDLIAVLFPAALVGGIVGYGLWSPVEEQRNA